jgi:hypothetical protein
LLKYIANLSTGRTILWSYFIWYAVVVVRYFDANPRLWLTSLGLSAVIGIALVISASSSSTGTMKLDRWQMFRLFLMPFCVSSFSALVKGKNFTLIFSPRMSENYFALGLIAIFCAFVIGVKMACKNT